MQYSAPSTPLLDVWRAARWGGGFGRGRGEVATRGSARPGGEVERRGGAGEVAPGCGRRRGRGEEGGGRLEVGDEPDRWAPPVGEREREERGGGVDGPAWAESERWAAEWVG
jgi:hypothetical protein